MNTGQFFSFFLVHALFSFCFSTAIRSLQRACICCLFVATVLFILHSLTSLLFHLFFFFVLSFMLI